MAHEIWECVCFFRLHVRRGTQCRPYPSMFNIDIISYFFLFTNTLWIILYLSLFFSFGSFRNLCCTPIWDIPVSRHTNQILRLISISKVELYLAAYRCISIFSLHTIVKMLTTWRKRTVNILMVMCREIIYLHISVSGIVVLVGCDSTS